MGASSGRDFTQTRGWYGLVGPIYRECLRSGKVRFHWNTRITRLTEKVIAPVVSRGCQCMPLLQFRLNVFVLLGDGPQGVGSQRQSKRWLNRIREFRDRLPQLCRVTGLLVIVRCHEFPNFTNGFCIIGNSMRPFSERAQVKKIDSKISRFYHAIYSEARRRTIAAERRKIDYVSGPLFAHRAQDRACHVEKNRFVS